MLFKFSGKIGLVVIEFFTDRFGRERRFEICLDIVEYLMKISRATCFDFGGASRIKQVDQSVKIGDNSKMLIIFVGLYHRPYKTDDLGVGGDGRKGDLSLQKGGETFRQSLCRIKKL